MNTNYIVLPTVAKVHSVRTTVTIKTRHIRSRAPGTRAALDARGARQSWSRLPSHKTCLSTVITGPSVNFSSVYACCHFSW